MDLTIRQVGSRTVVSFPRAIQLFDEASSAFKFKLKSIVADGNLHLVIDMVDAKTNKVVWRGWAQDSMTGVIDNQTRLEKQIDEAVTKMMKELPNHL